MIHADVPGEPITVRSLWGSLRFQRVSRSSAHMELDFRHPGVGCPVGDSADVDNVRDSLYVRDYAQIAATVDVLAGKMAKLVLQDGDALPTGEFEATDSFKYGRRFRYNGHRICTDETHENLVDDMSLPLGTSEAAFVEFWRQNTLNHYRYALSRGYLIDYRDALRAVLLRR